MPNRSIRRFSIQRISAQRTERSIDEVAAEEPLEINVRFRFKQSEQTSQFAVTMRTPGNDLDLAAGLLLSEGVIRGPNDLLDLRSLGTEPSKGVLAVLSPHCDYDVSRLDRSSYVNSSCGICGKRTREAIAAVLPTALEGSFFVDPQSLTGLPEKLAESQLGFAATGGLHAAALVTGSGQIEATFEDIGRHNALDKLLGYCLLAGRLPLVDRLLFLSSRSSFELVQKALMAGAPMLATIGGPSSLAIELAREHCLTLIGFIRQGHFNVYSGEWRVHSKQDETALSRE